MKTKIIEVRDRATIIPMIAIKVDCKGNLVESYNQIIAGYSQDCHNNVILIDMRNGKGSNDPYHWGREGRTIFECHLWLQEHFDEVESGDVVDVEYILKEVTKPKISQVYTSKVLGNGSEEPQWGLIPKEEKIG